jgi:SAM-dependent methyltransferase
MDASLRQKLDDLLPWVLPGRIVDKGCGTGKLLVELSRSFPTSAFVGVDLSREFLRRCDENTYHAEDVTFVRGDAAEVQLPSGSATTILFSSIMHEIYSYSGYDQAQVERALASAATELAPGGRLLIRDGVSPGPGRWRLRLLHAQTRETFRRFAVEFKRGKGAQHRWVSEDTVELSAHLANEFLCKKDYLKSWDIEVHEEFGVRTVNEWRDALGRHGFDLLELCSVVNPWIVQHRYEGQVELTDVEGHPIPWPATNVIVAAERRGGEAAGARPDRPRER